MNEPVKELLALGVVCTVLQLVDGLTTYVGVFKLGFEECIEGARQLMDAYGPLGIVICKIIVILCVVSAIAIPVIVERYAKDNRLKAFAYHYFSGILIMANVYYVYVVANNLYWITLWAMKVI